MQTVIYDVRVVGINMTFLPFFIFKFFYSILMIALMTKKPKTKQKKTNTPPIKFFKKISESGRKKVQIPASFIGSFKLLMLKSLECFLHNSLIQKHSLGCGIGPGYNSLPENSCSEMACIFQRRKWEKRLIGLLVTRSRLVKIHSFHSLAKDLPEVWFRTRNWSTGPETPAWGPRWFCFRQSVDWGSAD